MTDFAARWFERPWHFWMSPSHRGHGRGGHGRGYGHGFDPRAFWQGPWRGMGFGPGRRSRAKRGDVRAAALLLLAEEPRNGYQLMEEIERRSGGAWRPSPGSIYPALAQLEDEGLVSPEEAAGRRAYRLTAEGEAYVEEHREAFGSPWEEAGEGVPDELVDLRTLIAHVGMATLQVGQSGDEKQVAEAKEVLSEARKSLYRILADED
jgi:DNA-binding PadR family transcriptional regulator